MTEKSSTSSLQYEGDHWRIQIVEKYIIPKTDWIEEEDLLLDWAENANFEKLPPSKIAITIIYVDLDHSVVGIAKSYIDLEPRERSSILYRSEFFDKIRLANNPFCLRNSNGVSTTCAALRINPQTPSTISKEIEDIDENKWLKKTYVFEDAAIYHIPNDHENIENVNANIVLTPVHFNKDVEKIHNALLVFHDLSEIFVIMREVKKIGVLKSIIRDGTNMSKTKKVRITDDSPKEFVFSKLNPVSGKRRTQKKIYY